MSDHALRAYDSILDMLSSVENPTPIVRLLHVTPYKHTQVFAKLEWYNPFGAFKDRVAANLVRDAEERARSSSTWSSRPRATRHGPGHAVERQGLTSSRPPCPKRFRRRSAPCCASSAPISTNSRTHCAHARPARRGHGQGHRAGRATGLETAQSVQESGQSRCALSHDWS